MGAASADDEWTIALNARAVQSGARSGVTNTVFTVWLPQGLGFAGLSGGVSFSGTMPGFSESLITVGMTADGQAACAVRNRTWPSAPPALRRLWAAILKNTAGGADASPVGVAVDFALPFPVAPAGAQGSCVMILISGGYPYLDVGSARYVSTTAVFHVRTLPAAGGSAVLPLGFGGEFRFAGGNAISPLSSPTTYVGIQASRRLTVDAIAGSVSAAPVTGAPAGSPWLPTPRGAWAIATDFVVLRKAACARAGFAIQASNGTYAVLRHANAAAFTMPAGSRTVLGLPLSSHGAEAVQATGFEPFPSGSRLVLEAGDCLVAFHALVAPAEGMRGVVNYENQSTVYVRAGS